MTIRNIYVHAPFCARRCCYCDFAVTVDRRPDSARWLRAIRREVESNAAVRAALAPRLDTLYVGGGTPSVLGGDLAASLARIVGRERLESPGLEWTMEANPESFTEAVAGAWAEAGVNRVSLGVQSFDPRALRWMGRLHTSAATRTALDRARAAGIRNASVDLIFGLPDHLGRDWQSDVDQALELDPPHVSLYGLTVEDGTPLARQVREGRATMPAGRRYRDEYLYAADTLASAGYQHYEVSNFARPGHASRHNRACWRGAPYLGLGSGAHSFWRGRRWWNEPDWAAYEKRVLDSGSARAGSERLTAEQRRLEGLWLGLRTTEGVDPAALGPAGRSLLRGWQRRGLAVVAPDRARLTPEGWLLLDELAVELDSAVAAA